MRTGGTGGVTTAGSGGTSGSGAGRSGGPPFGGEGGARDWPECSGPGRAINFQLGVGFSIHRPVQDDFTIEVWIKKTGSRTGTYFWEGDPIAWADTSNHAPDFALSVLNGKLIANIGVPDSAVTTTVSVATGSWVHIAVTRQRSDGMVRLYVNGVLDGVTTANASSLDTEPMLTIGSTAWRDKALNGWMDELKIWETVRTLAQIKAGMNQPPREDEPGLVGYYRFDELTGSTVLDLSSWRNDGTVWGANAWDVSDAPLCEPEAE